MFVRFFASIGSFGIYILAFIIGGSISYWLFYINFLAALEHSSTEVIPFIVEEKAELEDITKKLEKKGIIKNWFSVYYLARFRGAEKSESGSRFLIAPGEYRFSPSYTPGRVLEALQEKEIHYYEFVIPPGVMVPEVAKIISESKLVDQFTAEAALTDRKAMARLGLPKPSFEGYLNPGSYKYTKPISAPEIIQNIISEGKKQRQNEIEGWKSRAATEFRLNPFQVITLASIIEKETIDPEERATISSVFHNRLNLGLPLKSEATVRYGLRKFEGKLSELELRVDGPYNTFLNTGLPQTPICNPGIESLRAALFPKDTVYLFFAKLPNGRHHFSASIKEHQKALKQIEIGIIPE